MQQYMRIFSKKVEDDFIRYWASVSTEKTKDGKGTGKYARANITCRLSRDAEETFKTKSEKTKTKGIKLVRLEVTEFYPMAARPKDKDAKDYVYLYIKSAKVAESKDDDEDEEDD